jgi:hypothetical protein
MCWKARSAAVAGGVASAAAAAAESKLSSWITPCESPAHSLDPSVSNTTAFTWPPAGPSVLGVEDGPVPPAFAAVRWGSNSDTRWPPNLCHTLSFPSCAPVTTAGYVFCCGWKATEYTKQGWRRTRGRIVFVAGENRASSQILAVPSAEAEARARSSGLHAREWTQPWWALCRRATSAPDRVLQGWVQLWK